MICPKAKEECKQHPLQCNTTCYLTQDFSPKLIGNVCCPICGKSFESFEGYGLHVSTVHNVPIAMSNTPKLWEEAMKRFEVEDKALLALVSPDQWIQFIADLLQDKWEEVSPEEVPEMLEPVQPGFDRLSKIVPAVLPDNEVILCRYDFDFKIWVHYWTGLRENIRCWLRPVTTNKNKEDKLWNTNVKPHNKSRCSVILMLYAVAF